MFNLQTQQKTDAASTGFAEGSSGSKTGESRIAENRWHVLIETGWVTWDKYLSEGIPDRKQGAETGSSRGVQRPEEGRN